MPPSRDVIIGLLTPARPFQNSDAVSDAARSIADETTDEHDDPDEDAAHWRHLSWLSQQAISPLALAQHALHPWTSYVILPLFALANVGIVLNTTVTAATFAVLAASCIAGALGALLLTYAHRRVTSAGGGK